LRSEESYIRLRRNANGNGESALELAINQGDLNSAKDFLKLGSDPLASSSTSDRKKTSLRLAFETPKRNSFIICFIEHSMASITIEDQLANNAKNLLLDCSSYAIKDMINGNSNRFDSSIGKVVNKHLQEVNPCKLFVRRKGWMHAKRLWQEGKAKILSSNNAPNVSV
jgi:post-segregation antitoxin (ccd killing protein)